MVPYSGGLPGLGAGGELPEGWHTPKSAAAAAPFLLQSDIGKDIPYHEHESAPLPPCYRNTMVFRSCVKAGGGGGGGNNHFT